MDKQAALTALLQRCFDARIPVYKLCDLAKVSRATPSRWKANPNSINPSTLGKMEDALGAYERERAS